MSITIQDLPKEIILIIFSHTSVQDLTHRINFVCKKFQDLSNDDNLWIKETISKFGSVSKQDTGSSSWKDAYRKRLPVFYDGSLKRIMHYETGTLKRVEIFKS